MIFSEKALSDIKNEYQTVPGKHTKLLEAYLTRRYNDERAQEYAHHGVSRRLNTLVRCIESIFKILPPDRADLPTREERLDASINLQAFVLNVFGCTDNLAWVWVSEKGITKEDGSEIPKGSVGLRKKNPYMSGSFSPEFLEYLTGLDVWFGHLENFRHALAHRIPLYIPPYTVTKDNEAAYQDLENRIENALNRADLEEIDRLSAEQDALKTFRPLMTHSFGENAKKVVFHSQLLADFNTIEGLGWKMLEELNR